LQLDQENKEENCHKMKIEYSPVKNIRIDDLVLHKDNFVREVDRESQKVFEEAIAEQGVEVPILIV